MPTQKMNDSTLPPTTTPDEIKLFWLFSLFESIVSLCIALI